MAGIFGVVSEDDCIRTAVSGIFYLQNRAEDYCGLAWKNGRDILRNLPRRGLVKPNFSDIGMKGVIGCSAIGCVSGNSEPVSEFSYKGGMIMCYDGNIANHDSLKNKLLNKGTGFSGYHNLDELSDTVLISKIIASEPSFEKGIEHLIHEIDGDFSIVALNRDGIYAARGWGRKPLIIGEGNNGYAVSSESVSFINPGFKIVRDVEPGEVVFLDKSGVSSVAKFDLDNVKYGTFEWIYTAHPASVIDGRSVEIVRNKIGAALAKRFSVDVDLVSPVPNSGRCYADGYATESGIPHREVFKKFDYCGRSFTPNTLKMQRAVADEKLIPVASLIEGNRIVIVDDSIVKGNQTRKQTARLRELGAKEVHARIACPPLMAACRYGKSIKTDEDCIAKTMSLEEIRQTRNLDSLEYATPEDLEDAIGLPLEKLCLDCWGLDSKV